MLSRKRSYRDYHGEVCDLEEAVTVNVNVCRSILFPRHVSHHCSLGTPGMLPSWVNGGTSHIPFWTTL